MKKTLTYILASMILCLLHSCVLDEAYEPTADDLPAGPITFTATPKGYVQKPVTKAEGAFDDGAIHNAYFLLFDDGGTLRLMDNASVEITSEGSPLVTYSVGEELFSKNYNLTNATICFIANVDISNVKYPSGSEVKSLTVGETTWTDFETAYLENINYATYSEVKHLGVPKITVGENICYCIPLFGYSSNVEIKKASQSADFDLKLIRLFAKVSVDLKMNLSNPGIGQIVPSTVNYELGHYVLYNLPTKVRLVESEDESAWVTDDNSFVGTITSPITSGSLNLQTTNESSEGIEFDFYVPEYRLSPKATLEGNDQIFKPKNYPDNTNPIYLDLVGEVNRSLIDNTGVHHKIYLGGNPIDDFSLDRNTHYKNNLTIKGIDKHAGGNEEDGNLDWRVSVDVINNPVAQAGKSANCYVVTKSGDYTFPAYKGAYNSLEGAPLCLDKKENVTARVVEKFNKSQSTDVDKIPIKDYVYDHDTHTISFTVDKLTALGVEYFPGGNVILELQYLEDGSWKTEWSWHLWFIGNLPIANDMGMGWGQIDEDTTPGSTKPMLDRNMGVVSGTPAGAQTGFYYKYGEHTPYIDDNADGVFTKFGGGSISSSPTWSSTKSPTDPCPPGYKVPSSSMWKNPETQKFYATGQNEGITTSFLYNNNINYPYSGYLNDNLRKEDSFTKAYKPTLTYTETIKDGNSEYRNIEYSINLNYISGALFGTDDLFIYESVDQGVLSDIMLIKYETRYFIGLGNWGYWSDWSSTTVGSGTWDSIIQLLLENLKDKLAANISDLITLMRTESINTSYYYQVRCVAE